MECDYTYGEQNSWYNGFADGADASLHGVSADVLSDCKRRERRADEGEVSKTKRAKYKKTYPRLMYSYFALFSAAGAPSFSKFARSIGVTLADLEGFRKFGDFDAAWRECNEIRRDYLIDSALTKRHDPSFTKFILCEEYGTEEGEDEMNITLEVLE